MGKPEAEISRLRNADHHDGHRLGGRLSVLYPLTRAFRSVSPSSISFCTASCSTSGTSTSCTISSSCGRRCGSATSCGRRGDGWLIDGFGPDGVSARVLDVTRNAVRLQTGYLYHYAFAMLIGAAALITWFMFGRVRLRGNWPVLSVVTFLPLVGALFIVVLRGDGEPSSAMRAGSRCGPRSSPSRFRWCWSGASTRPRPEFQFVEKTRGCPATPIITMGVDGISLPLVILTTRAHADLHPRELGVDPEPRQGIHDRVPGARDDDGRHLLARSISCCSICSSRAA